MKHLKCLITFVAFITIAMSVASCGANNRYTVLGQPEPVNVSTKWSQLKKGMNLNQVRSLLGYPIRFEKTSNSMKWSYSFGTVTFEGRSLMMSGLMSGTSTNGQKGKLVSWERR